MVTGYPLGPANLPVNAFGPWAQVRGGQCPRECRHGFLNATRGRYYFTHKPPASWMALYDGWYNGTCPRGAPPLWLPLWSSK